MAAADHKDALGLVRPCPEDWLTMVPVSSRVNKVANDDPDLQTPLAAPEARPEPPAARKADTPRSSDEDELGRLF